MVDRRGNLIDGDWKLTKAADAAQKKNAKASNAWAGVTASSKGTKQVKRKPSNNPFTGQRTRSTGRSSGGSSKYSAGEEARNAYVESLRAQAAIRAAEEQRVVRERRQANKPRPGLPMTGGGDEDGDEDGGILGRGFSKPPAHDQQLFELGKKSGASMFAWLKDIGKGMNSNGTPTFDELRKQERYANEQLQKRQSAASVAAAELVNTKEVQEALKEAGVKTVSAFPPSGM